MLLSHAGHAKPHRRILFKQLRRQFHATLFTETVGTPPQAIECLSKLFNLGNGDVIENPVSVDERNKIVGIGIRSETRMAQAKFVNEFAEPYVITMLHPSVEFSQQREFCPIELACVHLSSSCHHHTVSTTIQESSALFRVQSQQGRGEESSHLPVADAQQNHRTRSFPLPGNSRGGASAEIDCNQSMAPSYSLYSWLLVVVHNLTLHSLDLASL